jgi:hypothetical protein
VPALRGPAEVSNHPIQSLERVRGVPCAAAKIMTGLEHQSCPRWSWCLGSLLSLPGRPNSNNARHR